MDRGARSVGMVVFVLGIVALLGVFWMAYRMFASPASELLPQSSGGATAIGLGSSLLALVVRIALLFVMTLAGSLTAARGIHLYSGCRTGASEQTSHKE